MNMNYFFIPQHGSKLNLPAAQFAMCHSCFPHVLSSLLYSFKISYLCRIIPFIPLFILHQKLHLHYYDHILFINWLHTKKYISVWLNIFMLILSCWDSTPTHLLFFIISLLTLFTHQTSCCFSPCVFTVWLQVHVLCHTVFVPNVIEPPECALFPFSSK